MWNIRRAISIEKPYLEVIVRNRAAGSIVRTTTIQEGQPIIPAIVEFFLKDDSKHDPLLTPDRVKLMGIDPKPLQEQASIINELLLNIFNLIGMDLIDFKIEFGIDNHGELLLADEISPDSMRLWSKENQDRFDKDLFRLDEGDLVPAYRTILDKLQLFVWHIYINYGIFLCGILAGKLGSSYGKSGEWGDNWCRKWEWG